MFVIVESENCFKYISRKYGKKVTFLTNSPYLINFFEQNRIKFISLDTLLGKDERKERKILEKFSCHFNKHILKFLEKNFKQTQIVNYELIFQNTIPNFITSIFYKKLLLHKAYLKFKDKLFVAGEDNFIFDFERLSIDRFANVFIYLSKDYPQIKRIIFKEKNNLLTSIKKSIKARKMSLAEKSLSILSNNISSFFFKIFLKINRIFHFSASLYPFNKKEIVVYGTTDHIEDEFLKLIFKGYKVSILKKLPNLNIIKFNNSKYKKKFFSKLNFNNLNPGYKIFNQNKNSNKTIFSFLLDNLINTILSIHRQLPHIEKEFSEIHGSYNKNFTLFSNIFTDKMPIMFSLFCKSKKNKVVCFEHGFSTIFNKKFYHESRYYNMRIADHAAVFAVRVKKFFGSKIRSKFLISGLSKKAFNKNFYNFKKLLIKILLNDKSDNKKIVYIMDVEVGNFYHSCHYDTDYSYYQSSREIMKYLCEKYKHEMVYVKLYPAARHINTYYFDDMKQKYSNLRVVKNYYDFRFLREFFDIIYLSSTLSTLGWAVSSGKKVYLIEKKNQPHLINGLYTKQKIINSKWFKKIYLMKKNIFKYNNSYLKIILDKIKTY